MTSLSAHKTYRPITSPHPKLLSDSKSGSKDEFESTRSNSPKDMSPTRLSFSNSSDSSSSSEGSAAIYSFDPASLGISDISNFEIDVRPKRKRFHTVQERLQFVEEYKRKYKTEMCKNWDLRGSCKFGDKCCFAHGKEELKAKTLSHIKYKTKPCKQYHQSSYCPYGQRCQYLHKTALIPNIFFQPLEDKPYQNFYTYEMLFTVSMMCDTDADIQALLDCFPQRPRLEVFTRVATENFNE